MKKGLIVVALVCCIPLLVSCDFFRRLAGRPTSEVIAQKRQEIEKEEARHQARLDSLAIVEKQVADSLALLDRIKASGKDMRGTARLGGLAASVLPNRYYIIIGVFSNKDNASRLSDKARAAGVEPVRIPCSNGCTAIGIFPCDRLSDLYEAIGRTSSLTFCLKDTWILVNE